MKNTENYNLPKYEANDTPNLLDGYNNAMDKIDSAMKANKDTASNVTNDISELKAQMAAATESGLKTLINTDVSALHDTIESEINTIHEVDKDQETLINNNAKNIKTIQDTLNTKDIFLLFGDSWSDFSESGRQNWFTTGKFAERLNCTAKNYAKGGSGFHNFSGATGTFITQVNNAVSELTSTEKKCVKYISITGGVNDLQDSEWDTNALLNAFNTLINVLVTNFPNARIAFFHTICTLDYNKNMSLKSFKLSYELVRNFKWNAVCSAPKHSFFWVGFQGSSLNIFSDGLHLGTNGVKAFAQLMLSLFNFSNFNTQAFFKNTTCLNVWIISAHSTNGPEGTTQKDPQP